MATLLTCARRGPVAGALSGRRPVVHKRHEHLRPCDIPARAFNRRKNRRASPFSRIPWGIEFDLVEPFFEGSIRQPCQWENKEARHVPIDVIEEDEGYVVKADFPGVSKDRITVDVDGDTISMSVSEQKVEGGSNADEPKDVKVHCMERSSVFVKRTVRLPDAADMDGIAATYVDGVLQLDIPKKDSASGGRRNIPIG